MEIQLRTPEDELARVWLNNPKFITTVDRGDRLLMFFREEIPSQNPELKRNRVKGTFVFVRVPVWIALIVPGNVLTLAK